MSQRSLSQSILSLSLLCSVLSFVSFSGCSTNKPKKEEGKVEAKPVVAVSNYPLQFFVERIAKDNVDVLFPVEEGIDPAFWAPSGEAVKKMQDADLILFNGAGYESWSGSVTLPASKTVDTCVDVKGELIETEEEVVHQHGPEGEHSHKGTAFTTWLDPDMAISQALATHRALVKVSPYHQATFDDNYRKLKADLRESRAEMVRVAKSLQGLHLMGSHPVYQYLQRAMKLDMHSVHFEPDQEPTAEQWAEFDKIVAEHPTQLMLWEAAPLPTVASELQKRGIKVVVFSQMGNQPKDGDLLSGLQASLVALESAALGVSIEAKNKGNGAEAADSTGTTAAEPGEESDSGDDELTAPEQSADEEIDQ